MVLTDLNLVLLAIAASNLPPCDSQVTPVPEENSTTTEPVTAIMDNIPPNYRKVTVIASEEDSATLTKVLRHIQVPAVVNSLELVRNGSGLDTRVPNDLVVIMNDEVSPETILNQSLWYRDTRFLVVSSGRNIDVDLGVFWEWNAMNVFALVGDSVYTFLPYHNGTCDMSPPIVVDVWKDGAFENGGLFLADDVVRLGNLNGCRVNISSVDIKPSVFFSGEGEQNEMDGIEARYLNAVAEKMNFAAAFSKPLDGKSWGGVEPPIGALGDVYQRTSHFGTGFFGPLPKRSFYFDLSRPYNGRECITFVVPSEAGRDDLAWLHNITAGLRPVSWCLILASLLSVVVILWLAGKYPFMTSFMYAWTALMGYSIQLPKNRGLKYLMMSWVVCGAFVTGIYQASLGSRVTIPLKSYDIETLPDLLKSDLTVMGYPNLKNFFENAKDYPNLIKLAKRFHPTDMKVGEAINNIVEGHQIAYASQSTIFTYARLEVPRARERVKQLKECITSYQAVIVMQRNSPFEKALDDVIWRIFESGIGAMWKLEFTHGAHIDSPKFVPFELRQGLGAFVVLAVGLSASFVSFFVELGLGCAKGCHAKPKKMKKTKRFVRLLYL